MECFGNHRGCRGTGKTILLNWVEAECSKEGVVAISATPSGELQSMDVLPELLLPGKRSHPDRLVARFVGVKA